ncbi:DUF3558 domain-containing protein [Nocardia tengchongensis]|uniref:DUF3558 domain-containing protein n=1 Tax=Nocardia tengchongensis TaxID=2055889 RepID=UPI0036BA4A90
MTRAGRAAVGIALIGLTVAGCGSSSEQRAAPATTTAPQAVLPSPDTVGLCGGVSDAEVAQATGSSGVQRVSADPVSCAWQPAAGGDYAVVFHWFRGSSLEARRDQVTAGKPETVRVAGQSGIEWRGAQSCEVAVAFGDTDFIDWSERVSARSCQGVEQLAAATLTNAGQS